MLNKTIIISALLLMCAGLHAQELSESGRLITIPMPYQMGSGKVYSFEAAENDERNRRLYELFEEGNAAYENKEFTESLELLKEFENSYIAAGTNYKISLYRSKSTACELIAKILIYKRRYTEALVYIEKYKYDYPLIYTCGASNSGVVYNILKAECYHGMGYNDAAIQQLKSYLFFPSGLTDHREAIILLVKIMKYKYGSEKLKQELLLANIDINKDYHAKVNFLGDKFYIDVFRKPFLDIITEYQNRNRTDLLNEKLTEAFKEHYTYKLIMESN